MSIENKRGNVPVPTENGNAILVDKELVTMLESAISKGAGPLDKLPPRRTLIDFVVSKTIGVIGDNFIYRSGARNISEAYKYFGSEISTRISNMPEIKDKGRFVEACIIAYLFGERGLHKWCVSSKEIRPRDYGVRERAEIAKTAAEIADAKDVASGFAPTTHQEGIS